MKTRILTGGLCLAITATFIMRAAGQPAPANAPAATNGIGPRIQFDSMTYDWGTVRAGEKVLHDFVFTNTGDATLEVTGVTPGCHCTTVGDWTHQVEPGKTGVIPIQFNSTGFGGGIYRTPSVTCNDRNHPTMRLQLHGTVLKPVDISRTFVLLSIAPDASQETNEVVHIINNEDQPLLLAPPVSSRPTIAAELKTNTPGKSYDLIIKTVPPLPAGNDQAIVTLGTLSSNAEPIRIGVMASVQPVVLVTPPEIAMPAGPLETNKTISVLLQNKASHPLALSEPSVNAPGATASIVVSQPGQVFMATVDFAKGFVAPVGSPVEVTVKTDNPREPVVKIPVRQSAVHAFMPPSARMNQ